LKKFLKWSKREYNKKQRIIALIPAGILFLALLPSTLIISSSIIDPHLKLRKITPEAN